MPASSSGSALFRRSSACGVLVLSGAVELWLARTLLDLLELVTAGMLYIFMYLTVDLFFGILDL